MIEIKTKRLSLRHITPEYKKSLVNLIGDESVASSLSNVPFPCTESDADCWIESVKPKLCSLDVFSNDELIGGVGLTEHEHNLLELGYWIGKPYWEHGYIAEAVCELLRFENDKDGNKNVFANVLPSNHASEKVLSKSGFVEDGPDASIDVGTKSEIACDRYVLSLADF